MWMRSFLGQQAGAGPLSRQLSKKAIFNKSVPPACIV
jgi:hypothetical protein